MKEIKMLENITAEIMNKEKISMVTVFAYLESKENNNELLNFDRDIYVDQFETVIENLNRFEISEFTVTNNSTGLIEVIDKFTKAGFNISGTTKIQVGFYYDEPNMKTALVFKRGE